MTVLGCSLISWAGASNLDGFVSFIGSFAWSVLHIIGLIRLLISLIQRPPLLYLPAVTASSRTGQDKDATCRRLCAAGVWRGDDGVCECTDNPGLAQAGGERG